MEFFSQKLKPAESRCSTFGHELFVIYTVTKHFRHPLKGRQFHIMNDNKAFPFVSTSTTRIEYIFSETVARGCFATWSGRLGCRPVITTDRERQFECRFSNVIFEPHRRYHTRARSVRQWHGETIPPAAATGTTGPTSCLLFARHLREVEGSLSGDIVRAGLRNHVSLNG